jgi:hypothetical protein
MNKFKIILAFLLSIISLGSILVYAEYSDELVQAYNYAYKNRITTMDNIEKANMDGKLTRVAMAKMITNYAINIL